MNSADIMETSKLPLQISKKIKAEKVSIRECDDGSVLLLPIYDIKKLRGMAKGSGFTTETLLEDRRNERKSEDGVI